MNYSVEAPPLPQCPNPNCRNKNISMLSARPVKWRNGLKAPGGEVVAFCCENCSTILGIVAPK